MYGLNVFGASGLSFASWTPMAWNVNKPAPAVTPTINETDNTQFLTNVTVNGHFGLICLTSMRTRSAKHVAIRTTRTERERVLTRA